MRLPVNAEAWPVFGTVVLVELVVHGMWIIKIIQNPVLVSGHLQTLSVRKGGLVDLELRLEMHNG